MPDLHPADAVFEGGGVKGIALLGALNEMEKQWAFNRVAGTSAGAIVAAFKAAGLSAVDIRDQALGKVNLEELRDEDWEDKLGRLLGALNPVSHVPKLKSLPIAGRLLAATTFLQYSISVWRDFGIYEGDRFLELVRQLLHELTGKRTFGELLWDESSPKAGPDSRYRYQLRVIASDVTANRLLILPQGISSYGYDPDDLEIATALRMSMSIPIFFEPYVLKNKNSGQDHLIVDGGILSNFPLWLFDAPGGTEPRWPTFGFNLHHPAEERDGEQPWPDEPANIDSVVDFGRAIWDTMFSAIDRRYIPDRHWTRTIAIDDLGIPTAKFEISEQEEKDLWDSGVRAAQAYMADWGDPRPGFAAWNTAHREDLNAAQR
jgi:NTE family protein